MADKLCPACGATVTDDPPTVDSDLALPDERGLCTACYLDRLDLVSAPDELTIDYCGRCGAVKRGEEWVDVEARDHTDLAIDAVTEALAVHVRAQDVQWSVDPEQVDATTIRVHCHFSGVIRDTPIAEDVTVRVNLAGGTCTRCGHIAGDYYASIVQLRADGRDPRPDEIETARTVAEEVVEAMEATGDRNAFITEAGEVTGGLDLKVSTTKIGRKISRKVTEQLGGTMSTSETLVTEDEDGNEVYRVTYLLRLPAASTGDIIDLDEDGLVLVDSVREVVAGRRLTTGERVEDIEVDPDQIIGSVEDAQDTTVVAVVDEHAVQILDPETYEATTVARPDYFDPDAETVPVFEHRGDCYILPESAAGGSAGEPAQTSSIDRSHGR